MSTWEVAMPVGMSKAPKYGGVCSGWRRRRTTSPAGGRTVPKSYQWDMGKAKV